MQMGFVRVRALCGLASTTISENGIGLALVAVVEILPRVLSAGTYLSTYICKCVSQVRVAFTTVATASSMNSTPRCVQHTIFVKSLFLVSTLSFLHVCMHHMSKRITGTSG